MVSVTFSRCQGFARNCVALIFIRDRVVEFEDVAFDAFEFGFLEFDGGAPLDDAVEQRGLADVWPSDDGDEI